MLLYSFKTLELVLSSFSLVYAASTNSSLPIVDLGYQLQQASSFNVGFFSSLTSRLPEPSKLTNV